MTPNEKAIELAMKYDKDGQTDNAVICALICVDEILEELGEELELAYNYWLDVKHELSLL